MMEEAIRSLLLPVGIVIAIIVGCKLLKISAKIVLLVLAVIIAMKVVSSL